MSVHRLYSWGANSHGQLGQGDDSEEELLHPREVDLTQADLAAEDIVKIVGGAGHTVILDKLGRVYSCGRMGGLTTAGSEFRRIEDLTTEKIVDLACGWDWSLALTEDGRLFVWGSNAFGQLGLPSIAAVNTPRLLDLGVRFKRIAAGLRHSALLTQESRLLVSGASNKGQLGIEVSGARHTDTFTEVPNLRGIEEVACGQHHTVVITEDKNIYAWGDNKHGQLGLDSTVHKITTTPKKIEEIVNIDSHSKVYCGWTHTTILTRNKVFSWGRNTYGQLGRAKVTPSAECWKPEALKYLAPVQQLSVGSEHTVALTDDKAALSWGWNEHGNCGTGGTEDTFDPAKVLLPEGSVVLVGTGAGHSFAVVRTNRSANLLTHAEQNL